MSQKVYGESLGLYTSKWIEESLDKGLIVPVKERVSAYFTLCRMGEGASRSTKRKWAKRLGLNMDKLGEGLVTL